MRLVSQEHSAEDRGGDGFTDTLSYYFCASVGQLFFVRYCYGLSPADGARGIGLFPARSWMLDTSLEHGGHSTFRGELRAILLVLG